MLSGENWWGLCSNFGRQMPFNAKSDFKCDLRVSNYSHQSQSVLVSDKGRVLYCDAPVEATIGGTYVFELKVDKPAALATTQAERQHYAAPYLAAEKPVWIIGLSFDSKTRELIDHSVERFA